MFDLRDPLNQVRAGFLATAALIGAAGSPGEAAIVLILLVGTLLPRLLGVPRPFEIALVVGLSLQAIGGVLGLFRPDFGWDILVHAVLSGAAGACAYMALASFKAVADPRRPATENGDAGVLAGVAALGMALNATWEIVEGVSDELLGTALVRSQLDTAIDLLAGTMGSVLAGVWVLAWARRQREAGVGLPEAEATGIAE